MLDVTTVALYILANSTPMTTMKLHKLVYYVQALSLQRTGKPLINTEFYAWINGAVSRDLFNLHKHLMIIRYRDLKHDTAVEQLDEPSQHIINTVLTLLGNETGNELTARIRNEQPWIDARQGLQANQLGTTPIPCEAMLRYYRTHPIQ